MAKRHISSSVQASGRHPVFTLSRIAGAMQLLLITSLGVGALSVAAPSAFAQAAQARQAFSVPAGTLGLALNTFAAEAGIELTVEASLLQGKKSAGLSGSYSVPEGFNELLRGHSLQAVREGNGSYTVRREPAHSAAAEAAATLPAVTVWGKGNTVTDAYAGGQVASGGRVGFLGDKDFMETPFNTISYTDKFIEDRQARDITDVISATDPTVFSSGMTGIIGENYAIRGFSSGTSDVAFGGLFGVTPVYRTSPDMFERIEVLKGPSALLNGMPPGGSVGGSINLVPKRAADAPLARVTASYMSDAQWGGHIDLGRRFGENKQFGIRINGVYRDGDGAIDHQKKMTQLASVGLDWRGVGARLSADLYSSEDRARGLNRGVNLVAGLPVPRPPKAETLLNPSWAFYDTKDKGAMLRGEYDVNEQMMAYAAIGASKADYQSTGAYLIQVFNTAGDYRTNLADLGFKLEKQSAEVGVKGKFRTANISHQWAANATYYHHTDQQFGRRNVLDKDWITNIYRPVWGPATRFDAPQISKTELRLASVGLVDTLSFAQDQVQLTVGLRRQEVLNDSFNVKTGARISRYDAAATTPAVALLVKAARSVALYANYIEGLSQGATAPMTAANAGEVFAPYKSKQMEAGVKVDLGEFAHTLSVYEIKRPSSYVDPVSNVFSFGGEQRNRGVDWGFFGSPVRDVRLMGGIAYVDPTLARTNNGINQGKQAAGVPKLQAKLGVEWDAPPVPGLTLTANVTAASKQYINEDNSLSVPGRSVFDLGGRYATRVAGRPLTVRASVSNVANKAYWALPQWTSLGLGAPRTFMLSAATDF